VHKFIHPHLYRLYKTIYDGPPTQIKNIPYSRIDSKTKSTSTVHRLVCFHNILFFYTMDPHKKSSQENILFLRAIILLLQRLAVVVVVAPTILDPHEPI